MIEKLLKYKYHILKTFVLIGISALYLSRSANDFKEPFIKGDGIEYIMMTEALHNHLTPDMRLSDLALFRDRYSKVHGWTNPLAPKVIDIEMAYLTASANLFKEGTMGFYCNKNKMWHCSHFFFYSLINLPAYTFAKDPLRSFYFTNAFFVILTCFVLLFFTPFHVTVQILSAFCFCFSACYWYLGWQQAEVFTSGLIAIAFVALFNNKYYLSIIILALACLQQQPLIILLALFCLIALKQNGFNRKNLIRTALFASIALIPPIYYYINFGVTNMIKDAGFLDTKYITVNRVAGFYTDLSQGMILTIPLILLMYIPLLLIEVRKMIIKKMAFNFIILVPLAVLGISITVSTMGNWNHGMAIINRYASWASIIIMMHTFYLANQLKHSSTVILFNYFFMSQCFTTLYYQRLNKFDWSSATYTPIAKWALVNHSSWYDPDPMIFAGRTPSGYPLIPESSPIIFFYEKIPVKMMVHRSKVDQLTEFGFSKAAINHFKKKLRFNYDWAYINGSDINKAGLKGQEVYYKMRARQVQLTVEKIRSSDMWLNQIKQKAKDWNMPVDSVIKLDAEYSVSQGEQAEKD